MSMPTELSAPAATSVMTYREAINAALDDALSEDASVVFFGEDIANAGGIWKTSVGLPETYGPGRVWNTPICENGFLGVALGMAVTGLRPVTEIMFSDFLPTAADAIVNELPKFRFMSGGQCKVPVTIRSVGGAGGRFGTQHSATGESWFLQLPGLKLAAAGSPETAYGLLRAAIRDDNPVLVFEHKSLFTRKGPVTRGDAGVLEVGKACTLRRGTDVTIVATLAMVERAAEAAETLVEEGIDAEVIDLRWLRPLDFDTCRASVERTGRLVVVEEEYHHGGWGASLISRLTMDGMQWSSPPQAVSFPEELLIPYSPPLEDEIMPSAKSIASAARQAVLGPWARR
jgi:pyruvate/2-oxoglutarate/acetoin dehydrogenase E1 component